MVQAQLFRHDSNYFLFQFSIETLDTTDIFLPLEVADECGLVFERIRSLQSYSQIALHAAFFVLFAVLR